MLWQTWALNVTLLIKRSIFVYFFAHKKNGTFVGFKLIHFYEFHCHLYNQMRKKLGAWNQCRLVLLEQVASSMWYGWAPCSVVVLVATASLSVWPSCQTELQADWQWILSGSGCHECAGQVCSWSWKKCESPVNLLDLMGEGNFKVNFWNIC